MAGRLLADAAVCEACTAGVAIRVGTLVIAALVATAVPGACTPPPPATPPSSPAFVVTPSPSPSPSPPVIAGPTLLSISGRVTSPCTPPPSGCGYWVRLVLPDGETMRSDLEYDATRTSLSQGTGLPVSLPWGRYALVFGYDLCSDVVTFTTGPDGSAVEYGPESWVGCTATLATGEQPEVTVAVTFDSGGCKVRIAP